MTFKWDFDREYHIGRKDSAFYVIDDEGNVLEGPFQQIEFSHVSFSDSDHIKGYGEDGMEMLTKDGQEYGFPSNLTMNIVIGEQ